MRGETPPVPGYPPLMLKPSDRTLAAARRGRADPTLPEAIFWKLLRDRRLSPSRSHNEAVQLRNASLDQASVRRS
jgi:hypothetical protein